MDKKSAAEKVAKLRRVAEDPRTNASEATNARRTADRLAFEYSLGSADLEAGRMSAAYDELLMAIEKFVKNHPRMPAGIFSAEKAVQDVVGRLRGASESDKSSRLRTFVSIVRTANLFIGSNAYVSEVKTIMDTALSNNGVTI